jgi:hypothetical protein
MMALNEKNKNSLMKSGTVLAPTKRITRVNAALIIEMYFSAYLLHIFLCFLLPPIHLSTDRNTELSALYRSLSSAPILHIIIAVLYITITALLIIYAIPISVSL